MFESYEYFGLQQKVKFLIVFPFALIYANNVSSMLSSLNRRRRQNCELRQTVRDIYNSGYECGAAESGNSRSSLGKRRKR